MQSTKFFFDICLKFSSNEFNIIEKFCNFAVDYITSQHSYQSLTCSLVIALGVDHAVLSVAMSF